MQVDKISGFASSGINNDLIPVELPSRVLTYAKNMRSVDGGISPFGGYKIIGEMPAGFVPRDLIYSLSDGTKFWIITGDDDILKFQGSFTSVKPTGMPTLTDGSLWCSTLLSSIPVINHPATGPMYLSSADTEFQPLPWAIGETWADANQTCDIIVSHKQFLFALRINDNGVEHTDAIRWSSPADIGGVPETWNPLDITNVAGYTNLGGDGGSIIGALPLKDALAVYRQSGITILDYVGGSFVWRIRHLDSSAGLISKDSVVDVNGVHYFISDGDVYRNDGNKPYSIAHDRIKKSLNSISKQDYDKSYAVHNPSKKEILFCIPSTASDYPDFAYVYNYVYDSWLPRDLPVNNKSAYGVSVAVSTAWDDLGTDWDGFGKSWSDDSSTPFDNSIVSIVPPIDDEPAKVIAIDSILGFNEEPFNSIIERTDYAIGGLGQVNTITRIYPKIQGGAKVSVQIGSQSVPGGPVSWKPIVQYDPGSDRKIDIRSTGILHAYRLFVNDVKTDFLISGMDIEYVPAGTR